MNVLSLFDGMSCGMLALERAGIKVDNYYASEIDKWATQVSDANYPAIHRLGDVQHINYQMLPDIDLLIAGSPCQGFSFAGKQLNFSDPRSVLFFEFVHAIKTVEPKYFLLENVMMKQEFQDVISDLLGCQPIMINSSLVSAQNRKRLYWTNIPDQSQPDDLKVVLADIVFPDAKINNNVTTFTERRTAEAKAIRKKIKKETGKDFSPRRAKEVVPRIDEKSNCLTTSMSVEHLLLTDKALKYMDRKVKGGRSHWDFKHHSDIENEKSAAVVANFYKGVPYNVFKDWNCIRKLDPIECERLQTVPDNYTKSVSNTQRYKMLGNGWTIDVISHIFKGIKQ